MKTVVITGCSWGAGEWGGKHLSLQHAGLAQYFTDAGYNVVNLSYMGSGNFKLIKPLNVFLEVNITLDIEYIFVLQTDIGRDLDSTWWANIVSDSDYDTTTNKDISLNNTIKKMYKQFYDNLNICLRNRNKKAYLIGGLTDLILDGHENFDCLEFLIPSWVQLCNPNNFPCHILNLNGLTDFDKKQLLPYMELAHKRLDYFKYSQDLFWPDGSHPNRLGHRLLYDAICSKLNL